MRFTHYLSQCSFWVPSRGLLWAAEEGEVEEGGGQQGPSG